MECILAVDQDTAVYEKAAARWGEYGVSMKRVETMHESIAELKRSDGYLFVRIYEDAVPEWMSMLPIMRDVTDIPIFVLSSAYTADQKIKALNLGADAYDFYDAHTNHDVLIALEVLNAQNRWARRPYKPFELLVSGDLVLSRERRKVFVNGFEVDLGKKEFDILRCLMENNGHVVDHKRLLQEIWGEYYDEKDAGVLWRTINRLRAKLSEKCPAREYISIARGVGYVLKR
ncbi:MAG: response regulator transcription factor [Clostridia bacterium]|nr:response regulator transcription factor [Clostridia bacterium]